MANPVLGMPVAGYHRLLTACNRDFVKRAYQHINQACNGDGGEMSADDKMHYSLLPFIGRTLPVFIRLAFQRFFL